MPTTATLRGVEGMKLTVHQVMAGGYGRRLGIRARRI
jgi:hypothetical protein